MADLLQKYRLLKGLCTGDRAHTGPFYATLDLMRRCNLRCLGCRCQFHCLFSQGPFFLLQIPSQGFILFDRNTFLFRPRPAAQTIKSTFFHLVPNTGQVCGINPFTS